MTRRSLKATKQGISRANKAVLVFATKIDLAAELEISRATVQNFFAGKPVGRENFHKICQKLELPWREIAELPAEPEAEVAAAIPAAGTVAKVRQALSASITKSCGMIRVLDMSQPLQTAQLYTNVNILEKISGRRRLEISDLLKVCVSAEFERPGLSPVEQTRVAGLAAVAKYAKLIVLGKPGAGKTTFLKHIAMQCNAGELFPELVPIFISLKDFAEIEQQPGLQEQIISIAASAQISASTISEIISTGQALLLLDGLDEVREQDIYRVMQTVRQFTSQYPQNRYVLSCRIATREYTLEEFSEVEIADFDAQQIANFASNWFAHTDPRQTRRFLDKLQQQRPIQELATNPLLLTLLSMMFAESGDFPANRAELYSEALNVLLRKWDAKRNIEREQIYKKLSIQHKEDLLGQIALMTFQRGDYFFKQKEVEQHIADYICNLPTVSREVEALQLDAEAVLKSIEAQHGLLVERARGIYSFSHLTFHEYFAAREIVAGVAPQALEQALQRLLAQLSNRRWREVFLLSVGMLRNADYLLLLMKRQTDALLAEDVQLQGFLAWVSQKSRAVTASYCLATVRAFYFDLDLARVLDLVGSSLDLTRALNPNFTRDLDFDLALDLALDRTLALNHVLDSTVNPTSVFYRVLARAIVRARVLNSELEQMIEKLQEQLPYPDADGKRFEAWWKANGQAWTDQFRDVMVTFRNFGHDWQFSAQQKDALNQYHYNNQLIVDCLNSNCYVTSSVRQAIKNTLLLPVAELDQLSQGHLTEAQ